MSEERHPDIEKAPAPGHGPGGRKVMILGVDGGTLDLIRPWAEAGLLPTFARLMAEGSWGTLRTVVPPVTPTAWSSFLTGTNPGRHGLYDFVGRRRGTYDNWLANASYRSGASIWSLLSQAGKQVVVFNVPITYPVEPVNGLFVSGLLTPANATDATWPPGLADDIRQAVPGFNFSPPGMFSPGEEIRFVEAIADLNRTTLQTARYLIGRQAWDLYMAVFMGVDIAGHFLWRQMAEGQGRDPQAQPPLQARLANAIRDCYQQIDAALADLIEAAGPDVYLVVMSDHGFGPLEQYLHINTWLKERGYLRLKNTPLTLLKRALYRLGITPMALYGALRRLGLGERMRRTGRKRTISVQQLMKRAFLSFADVDWSRTRLFSIGFAGPLWVNLKGRDPKGIVAPGAEYEALLDRVTDDLRELRDPNTGRPLIGEIHRRESLYWGGRVQEAPDLVFLPRDMKDATFGLMAFGSNRYLTPAADRTGTHRMEGILFLKGPGIRQGVRLEESSIMDIAPTVLALMGEPVPASMDGRVLEAAMEPGLCASLKIACTRGDEGQGAVGPAGGKGSAGDLAQPEDLDRREEEALREHLRGLGYVA